MSSSRAAQRASSRIQPSVGARTPRSEYEAAFQNGPRRSSRASSAKRHHAGWVGAFFIVIAALFALLWGGLSASTAIANDQLDPVPRLVVAIDAAVLLPVLCLIDRCVSGLARQGRPA